MIKHLHQVLGLRRGSRGRDIQTLSQAPKTTVPSISLNAKKNSSPCLWHNANRINKVPLWRQSNPFICLFLLSSLQSQATVILLIIFPLLSCSWESCVELWVESCSVTLIRNVRWMPPYNSWMVHISILAMLPAGSAAEHMVHCLDNIMNGWIWPPLVIWIQWDYYMLSKKGDF